MAKKFKITVCIIDGQLLRSNQTLWFNCDLVTPLGVQEIREYDKKECIKVRKAYMFMHEGRRFGSFDFTTLQQFLDYRNINCVDDGDNCCRITFNGCILTYGGNPVTYGTQFF